MYIVSADNNNIITTKQKEQQQRKQSVDAPHRLDSTRLDSTRQLVAAAFDITIKSAGELYVHTTYIV